VGVLESIAPASSRDQSGSELLHSKASPTPNSRFFKAGAAYFQCSQEDRANALTIPIDKHVKTEIITCNSNKYFIYQ
jgi:hypothetical protein